MTYQFHARSNVLVDIGATELFEYLDDPRRLSSHMGKSSWMMAGSKMDIRFDDKNGRAVGAEIVLEGKMMGIPLLVHEFVTESLPPHRKVWATSGPQKMIVIDQYQMGFEVAEASQGTQLGVFIDYDLPSDGIRSILGRVFGHIYARWCVERIAKDAAQNFKNSQV